MRIDTLAAALKSSNKRIGALELQVATKDVKLVAEGGQAASLEGHP